jgi:apolipoprotein N-acyltransferase
MTNQKHTTVGTPQQDRLSYLWLALGILLFAFIQPRWTIPLAAWLYPIFLLRFVRTQPLWRGILLGYLASALVEVFALQGVIPFPGATYSISVLGSAVFAILPYLIDRLLARRLGGLLGTLVFPLAVATVGYLNAVVNPFGTFGNPAYTQYGNLPLLQLVSVTGIWGIDLVMSWLAGLCNWAWERGFAWPRVRGVAALYTSLLALVLLFGGARLALFPAQGSTVRVAGISPSPALVAAADKQVPQKLSGTETQAQRALISQANAPVFDALLARSETEARAGAKIIVWPECSGGVTLVQEDEAILLARASALARTTGTYLDLGLCELLSHPVRSSFFTDEIILIDPTGSVVWRYQKAHPVPGEPWPAGDGQVPTVQTPYGRLANVVCFDADFPGTMRQAGQAGADLMLVPSKDWREIDPSHSQLITFRAIENGYSLVRQTSEGLAMTVDYEGNVLGVSDYFTTDPQVMVTYVPMQGVRTIYATIGDLFAWLSIAGLVVLIGVAIARRRTAGKAVEAAPSGEALPVS